MSVSLPAIEQPSPNVSVRNGRGSVSGDERGFGKLLKSNDGGQGGRGLAAQRSEASRDPGAAKLAVAADEALDETPLLDREARTGARTNEGETEPTVEAQDGEVPDRDEAAGAEALLPLLTALDRRPTKTAPARDDRPAEGDVGKAEATKSRPRNRGLDVPVERRPERTVTVLERASMAEPANQPPQATFGKTLAANLGALATQAPDRQMAVQDLPQARTGQPAASDALPGAFERTGNRQRGTILTEAVKRASQAREAGDERAETKPAITEPKSGATMIQPPAVSTGAPVVEALVAKAPLAQSAMVAHMPTQSASSGPMQSLKIQLHPAELGMVTARLRVTDGQLSIEVEVETSEAYNRLSGENEAIARALRSHGISVDQVVIQAPQAQANASTRDSTGTFADTSSSGADRNLSGGSDFGQSSGSSHADRNAGYDNGHEAETPSPMQPRADGGPGRGVYI